MPATALRFRVPATAEQLALVRSELVEYADKVGMAAADVEDVQTIATEACGNSIKHAYGGSTDGPIEVSAHVEGGELCLVIRDFGSGIGPRAETATPGLHAGLSIIGALSDGFRLSSRRGVGTELEACLAFDDA